MLYRVDAVIDLLKKLLAILSPFVVGTLMALLINLPLRFLENHMPFFGDKLHFHKLRRSICLSLSVLIVLAVITVLMLVIIPRYAAVEALHSGAQSD